MYQLKKIISLLFLIFCMNIINFVPIYSNEITSKMFLQLVNSATESSELIPNSRVNPAIFHSDSNIQIVSEIFPYKFGMSELQPISMTISTSILNNTAQIKSGISGVFNSVFNQYSFGVAVGFKISDKMSFGAEFEYDELLIKKSNSYSSIGVNCGAIVEINDILDFGLSIKFANQLENKEFRAERIYSGIGVKYTKYLYSDFGFKLNSDEVLNYYFRTKYYVADPLAFSIGYQNAPNTVYLGVLIEIFNQYSFTINIEKSEFLNYNSFIQFGIKL